MPKPPSIFHIIWKCPQQPSRIRHPHFQRRFTEELEYFRHSGLLSIHRIFHEQYHLDALVSFKTDNDDAIFSRLRKRLTKALNEQTGAAPLYFEAQSSDAFDRYERGSVLGENFDPLPSPLKLEVRPQGESRRFLLRSAGHLTWPARRVFHLSVI